MKEDNYSLSKLFSLEGHIKTLCGIYKTSYNNINFFDYEEKNSLIGLKKTFIGSLISGFRQFYRQFLFNYRKHLGFCDPTATLTRPLIIKGPENVYLYEDTKIANAVIMTTENKFIMKKHSSAVEGITVITGNHDRQIGRFFRTIKVSEKRAGLGGDVIVEEDCWIGVNVTLLMGVTVRRGSTVVAGTVVTKSTMPYSINGGVPSHHIKFYWTIEPDFRTRKEFIFSRRMLHKRAT